VLAGAGLSYNGRSEAGAGEGCPCDGGMRPEAPGMAVTMTWEGWFCVGLVALMMFALVRRMAGPDVILMGGATLLVTVGIISVEEMLQGFANEGLITICVLFPVAAGLGETGGMTIITQRFLGRPRSVIAAQARMMPAVSAASAFMNNTPVVAMFMPVLQDWCKKTGISPAKLYIPLSYAAIMGGLCTLIGTSTNLIVNGLYIETEESGGTSLGMFTITVIGVPALIVGTVYVFLASGRLLPNRKSAIDADIAATRNYTVEMLVEPEGAVEGMTIAKAGLRHLPGLYLMEIERGDRRIVAVGPDEVLRGNDRLIFVGVVESVKDLQRMRGLVPATDQVFKLNDPRSSRVLVEAVVSDNCPLRGQSVREGRFRTVYDAAVIAVHRNGQRIYSKIGDIVLRPGDTLLLETHRGFVEQQRNRRDFFLTSTVEGSEPIRHDRAWISIVLLVGMVVAASFKWLPLLTAALLTVGFMVVTRCCSATQARRSINWQVLIAIGAALAIGRALDVSGAATVIANELIADLRVFGAIGVLVAVYVITMLFAETMTHAAAVVLVFPIAHAAAGELDVSFLPFVICIMMAGSATFATPIGYQTNLMVYGAGGYQFADYIKFGLPLNILIMLVTVVLTPLLFPF
jgi:di/tricarboxylate transporter